MNRILLLLISLIALAHLMQAQNVGIGTSTPDASAILDISSTDKGLLIPRVTTAQRAAIVTPATGLQVYQTDGTKGIYYFDGTAWAQLGAAGNATGWSMTGNSGINPAMNFIGTTDAQPFIAKANMEQVFRFAPNSNNTTIGYQASHADYSGGTYNHVIGYKAGYNNVGSFGHFDGLQAGYNNTGNNNQFIGYNTGFTNSSGNNNLFIGSAAGYSNTTGSQNLMLGYQAGYKNTTGVVNLFTGYQAGFNNTTGIDNFFIGYQAGYANTTASYNYFSGFKAGVSNTTGVNNFFEGYNAGFSNTTGNSSYCSGLNAGYHNNHDYSHFSGYQAGFSNTTGDRNHFVGFQSGYNSTTGSGNHFEGYESGVSNITGNNNYFSGFLSGAGNKTGNLNYASGNYSGDSNAAGLQNYFSGNYSGHNNTSGSYNTFVGNGAGMNNISGSSNVFIGFQAGINETGNNKLYISNDLSANPLIYGEFDNNMMRINGHEEIKNGSDAATPLLLLTETNTTYATIKFKKSNAGGYWDQSAFVSPSYQNSCQMNWFANEFEEMSLTGNGDLYVWGSFYELSDSTLKKNITPLNNTLSKIKNLDVVTYNWKNERAKNSNQEIGFLAQEVEQQFPQLVQTNNKGEKAVSYTHMVPVLLESIKEQQTEIDSMKTRMDQMEALINTLLHPKD